ncbi:MAG: hypothetical protein ACJ75B_00265 [Flavisolibacter sp.]
MSIYTLIKTVFKYVGRALFLLSLDYFADNDIRPTVIRKLSIIKEVNMLFSRYNEDEIRNHCRQTIESLEIWLRTIIDKEMRERYGPDYLDAIHAGSPLLSVKLVTEIKQKQQAEPHRFQRLIDAAFLEDAIKIICHPNLWVLFQPYFQFGFPNGVAELRATLTKLQMPRNHLSHANPISHRQAEQIICYSHDIVESIKERFTQLNMQNQFNVPMFRRFRDSFGNERHFSDDSRLARRISFRVDPRFHLRPGDTLVLEVEVDATWEAHGYNLVWRIVTPFGNVGQGNRLSIPITNQNVSRTFTIECLVRSNKDWHKYPEYDDRLQVGYMVLPPLGS